MTQEELLKELKEISQNLIASAKFYKTLSPAILKGRPQNGGWTIFECFEHMNRYDDFYRNELEAELNNAADVGQEERTFRSGWIGGRSANSMLPKEKMKRMSTFKKMDPQGEEIELAVIDAFIKNHRGYLDLIRLARTRNLNKIKVKLTIPVLKFNAGDSFRFILNHSLRHMAQCRRIQEAVS